MPFVQAKCPECGGMLTVDDSKKAAVCQFCGEAFIVQDAINNYNTYNTTNNNYNTTHNYGDGAVVNVYENTKETEALLKRAFMFLEDGDTKSADEYCGRVLDLDPECGEAYLGKLMANMAVRTREQLSECSIPLESNGNYQKIVRYGGDQLKAEVFGYNKQIFDRIAEGKAKIKDRLEADGLLYKFGTYQGSPIEWRILEKGKGKMLLISLFCLEERTYNTSGTSVTWETSTLRKWLNEDFYHLAFTAEEKMKIPATLVENSDNRKYHTPGGNNTTDKVFLLSIDEAEKYFASDTERRATRLSYNRTSWWWLRTPGDNSYSVYVVDNDGYVYDSDFYYSVDCPDIDVRPALWINL